VGAGYFVGDPVNIFGTVKAIDDKGVAVDVTGSAIFMNIQGGSVSAKYIAINWDSSYGELNINDGTVEATVIDGIAINVNGGTFTTVNISGGTVEATGTNGVGIFVDATYANLNIKGGEIKAGTDGNAVYMTPNDAGFISLGNSPTVSGVIKYNTGKLSVTSTFAPSPASKSYTLALNSYSSGAIAVGGGANFLNNFKLYNQPGYSLAVSGIDLVVATVSLPKEYVIIPGTGSTFTATKGGTLMSTATNLAIQDVIDAIKTDANGEDCSIQFGSGGTNVLDIVTDGIAFNGSGVGWGLITLTGRLTSKTGWDGVIRLLNSVSVESEADITNTESSGNPYDIVTVNNSSTGSITISGGTVSSEHGYVIHNNSAGEVNIVGGMVNASNTHAIYNESNGVVNIINGSVSSMNDYAIFNKSGGEINISGGTVWAKVNTIHNESVGEVNISDGTVTAVTHDAIYNKSGGEVNISGGKVSADVNTIYNESVGNINISGGTVENTTGGNAVYNASTGGVVLGGDPTVTGVIKYDEGKLSVNGVTTFAPAPGKVYKIDLNLYPTGDALAVVGGWSFLYNFEIDPSSARNLVVAANNVDLMAVKAINKVTPDMSGISFVNAAFTYDGSPHSIYISGTLPTGVTVSYTNNARTAAGTYTVTATFAVSDPATYNVPAPMSATLTVNKASYNMSGVTFSGSTVTYDGSPHSIYISGTLPAGVTVTYTGNGRTAVGTYTVTASFSVADPANYNVPASKTATLTINAAGNGKIDPDMSGVSFNDVSVVYNGSSRSIYISGKLPTGVSSVSYTGNGRTAVGVYVVTAKFSVSDPAKYNEPDPMSAVLEITKADYDMRGVSFNDTILPYNGSSRSIYIRGTLPSGVSVSYIGNGQKARGTYTVTAKFSVSSPANYNVPEPMVAELVIDKGNYNMSGVSLKNSKVTYDGKTHSITISGTLPSGVSVSYVGNGQKEIGVYTVVAEFKVSDAVNYNVPEPMEAELAIEKATYSMSGVSLKNSKVTYDGKPHSITLSGTLPKGVTVSYFGNGEVEAGVYTVTAEFSVADPEHYNVPEPLTAILEIAEIKTKVSKPAVPNTRLVYTGEELSAGIPESPMYTVTGDRGTEVGTYTAIISLNDPTKYEWPDGTTKDLSLKWSIVKAESKEKFVPPAIETNIILTSAMKLSEVVLPPGYAWVNPAAVLPEEGGVQKFAVTYTDPSGNFAPVAGEVELKVQALSGLEFINPGKGGSNVAYFGEVYTVKVRLRDQAGETVKSAFRVLITATISGMTVPKVITTDSETGIGESDVAISIDVTDGVVALKATAVMDDKEYTAGANLRVVKRGDIIDLDSLSALDSNDISVVDTNGVTKQDSSSISIRDSEREIPNIRPGDAGAAIVPVRGASGAITVGPNPVGVNAASVEFFGSGVRIKSANLSIYDALGNFVNKVAVSDDSKGSSAKRRVGSWNLTDKRGRRVREGVYAVSGTIMTAGGKKEAVSLVIDVR